MTDTAARVTQLEAGYSQLFQNQNSLAQTMAAVQQTQAQLLQDQQAASRIIANLVEKQQQMNQESHLLTQAIERILQAIPDLRQDLKQEIGQLETTMTNMHHEQQKTNSYLEALSHTQTKMQAHLEAAQAEQKQTNSHLAQMHRQMGRLNGSDFERRIIRDTRTKSSTNWVVPDRLISEPNEIPADLVRLAQEAVEQEKITAEEAALIRAVDLVVVGHRTGPPSQTELPENRRYVVIEASVTPDIDDVTRAQERAQLLHQATGIQCIPAVAGESIDPALDEQAAELGVQLLRLPGKTKAQKDEA